MPPEPFGHCVLYHRDKEPQLVTSEEQYLTLMAEGGWENTPAAFGVITAPSTEQRAAMPQVQPTSPLGATRPDDGAAFAALLSQWQFQMNQHRDHIATLQDGMIQRERSQEAQQHQMDGLHTRLQAVEQWMVRQPSTGAPKAPPVEVSMPKTQPHGDMPMRDTSEKPESSAPASAPPSSRQERK
jgi:hypothetical protein